MSTRTGRAQANVESPAAVQLRPMSGDDVTAVYELARDIWNLHYPGIITLAQIDYMLAQRYLPSRLREEIKDPSVTWKLAERSARLLGFSSTHFLCEAGELKLDKLYVHPDAQGRGIGSRLIEDALMQAKARNCTALSLAVNRNNTKAVDVYERCGFVCVETRVTDIGNGYVMDDFIMKRPLQAA